MKASNLFLYRYSSGVTKQAKKIGQTKKLSFVFSSRWFRCFVVSFFCESGFLKPKVFEDVFVRSFDPKYFLVRKNKNLSFDRSAKKVIFSFRQIRFQVLYRRRNQVHEILLLINRTFFYQTKQKHFLTKRVIKTLTSLWALKNISKKIDFCLNFPRSIVRVSIEEKNVSF